MGLMHTNELSKLKPEFTSSTGIAEAFH